MYIEPKTNIRILKDVPLDTTYDHTLYFDNPDSQYQYFVSKTKYNLTNYTYQRVRRGYARVGIQAENLYNCNYMMFQNTSFGSKWFYAFIKSVEYINNDTSEIEFEIDVMQTWYHNYDLDECFVERNHVKNDTIGNHIEPETVECGEYVFNGTYAPVLNMTSMCVIIAVNRVNSSGSTAVSGTLYDGVYGSADLWVYDSTDVTRINDKVTEYIKDPEDIVGLYMIPKVFLSGHTVPSDHRLKFGSNALVNNVTNIPVITENDTLNGYKPKNNKLYTYPYNFYNVDNASGQSLCLRYEFFTNLHPVLQISGTITQPVTAVLRPANYKGVPSYQSLAGYTTLNTESLQLNGYPTCSCAIDSYKAWIAQTSVPSTLGAITSGINTMLGTVPYLNTHTGLTENSISNASAGSMVSMVGQRMTAMYTASIKADIARGTFNNGCANVANMHQQFYGGRCSISKQYAERIDKYFTKYGYAIGTVTKPLTNARSRWTYVKTVDCTITGSIPCDDARRICQIYNNGITFWKNGSDVGNYNLDNSPLGGIYG